jgi:hypothetical protein
MMVHIYMGGAVHKHTSTVWLHLRAKKSVGKVGEGQVIGKNVQRSQGCKNVGVVCIWIGYDGASIQRVSGAKGGGIIG